MAEDGALIGPVIKIIYETMNESDRGELKVTGVDRLLEYPEYSDAGQLKGLLGALEQKSELMEMISSAAERDPHGVVIGSEASVKEMNNSTVVFKTIVKDGRPVGAIGVIGPLRMDYAKVLSTLDGLTGNITDLLSDTAALPEGSASDENEQSKEKE